MLIITGKGLFRMNVSSIKIEDFALELIKVCEFIPGDIVKMSNLFLAGNESIYVYAIKDYDTSGENPENKVVTIEIDRATKCIKLYAISDDLDGSFIYDRIKTFLDYFKNNKIKVDIDIIKYLKSNTGIAEQSDLIFSKDVLDNKKINKETQIQNIDRSNPTQTKPTKNWKEVILKFLNKQYIAML